MPTLQGGIVENWECSGLHDRVTNLSKLSAEAKLAWTLPRPRQVCKANSKMPENARNRRKVFYFSLSSYVRFFATVVFSPRHSESKLSLCSRLNENVRFFATVVFSPRHSESKLSLCSRFNENVEFIEPTYNLLRLFPPKGQTISPR